MSVKSAGLGVLDDFARDAPDKGDALPPRPLKEIFEALAEGPDVDVKNDDLGPASAP